MVLHSLKKKWVGLYKMEAERHLRFIEDEIRRRDTVKAVSKIKHMTDEELKKNREKYLKEREKEFKRCGWLNGG